MFKNNVYFKKYNCITIYIPYDEHKSTDILKKELTELLTLASDYNFIKKNEIKEFINNFLNTYIYDENNDIFNYSIDKIIRLVYFNNASYFYYSIFKDLEIIDKMYDYKYDRLYTIEDFYNGNLESIFKYGIIQPNYKSKKLIREQKENEYNEIIFKVENYNENTIIQNFLFDNGYSWEISGQNISNYVSSPMYLFADYTTKYIYHLKTNPERFIRIDPKIYGEIYNISNYLDSINFLQTGDIKKLPTYKPKKLIYESINENLDNTLYVFDLDDTLVYSERFEDKVKHLIKENITPEEILKNEISKIDVDLEILKYENGRIYFNDPFKIINVDNNPNWVRKKDRIYLIQPDSYFLTDYSLPIGINEKIVELYNNVKNKCIISVRPERMRSSIKEILNKFDIEYPNYGLYLYSKKYHALKSSWKADNIIKICNENNFNSVNYYDDNTKMIKKIKYHINNKININFYKIDGNIIKLF
jgi:hypothetical protein